jgi:signal transduction histidine kinase/DNA-binding response OmpR family regulator
MDGGRKIRILLIEDDDLVRRMLVGYLRTNEYDVREAADGEAGLALFRAQRPDVVMTDLRMPKVDGWAVLAALRVEAPTTPVVVFSGAGDLESAAEAVRRGAWDYLTKPIFELSELDIVLVQVLERARLLNENRRYERELEALVEARTAALEASDRRLYQTIEGAAVGVFVVDEAGVVTHWNRACELITGVAARDVLGTVGVRGAFARGDLPLLCDMVLRGTPFDEMRARCAFEIAQSATVPGAYEFEDFFFGLGESGKWLFLTASPLRAADGAVEGVIETVQDVTPRKTAERIAARLDARMRQAQKMEALGTLARGIAHDFNNILAVAIGFAEMAREAVPDDGKAAAHLDRVLASQNRAAQLVRRILSFGRKSDPSLASFRLGPAVSEAVALVRETLPSSVRVATRVDPACGPILADGDQIGQVLLNLCTNACRAMAEAGGDLTISVDAVEVDAPLPSELVGGATLEPGRYARVTVADTGIGVDEATRRRMFEPYFSTKPVGEGTGLGLAVVHGIVARHGGAIRVDSARGEGTRVELYFPLSEQLQRSLVPGAPAPGEEPVRGNERVMYVDDEPQLVQLVEAALGQMGYRVTGFLSGERALEAFSEGPGAFDVAILDYVMPGLTGVETARRLHAARGDLPIILCTGFGVGITKADAERIGICEHLAKPTSVRAIAAAIRREIDRRGSKERGMGA